MRVGLNADYVAFSEPGDAAFTWSLCRALMGCNSFLFVHANIKLLFFHIEMYLIFHVYYRTVLQFIAISFGGFYCPYKCTASVSKKELALFLCIWYSLLK